MTIYYSLFSQRQLLCSLFSRVRGSIRKSKMHGRLFCLFSFFFCMHFAVVTKGRVYQRDRRCSLFLSLSSFKRAETRAVWVQTRVSWIGRRTFIQGAHNRYRGHNNKACACKIRRVQLRVTRVSFERGDCLLLIVKKKPMTQQRTLSFCCHMHERELSRGLFVTQRSVVNVRVDTIYSWLCQQADND